MSASWITSYAYRLVRIVDDNGSKIAVPVRHQWSYDLLLNVGAWNRVAFGLAAPAILYQTGNHVAGDPWRAPTTALGDPSLEAKFVIVPKGELGGYGLAALSRVTFPLGTPESGLGDGAVTVQGRLLGELDLIVLGIRASAGFKARTRERVFWGDQFGHSAPWAVGVTMRPQALGWDRSGRWTWFLDLHGSVAITPELATKHSSPVAIAASSRYSLGSDLSLLTGVELPLNNALGAPSVRAVLGLSWAPRFYDADEDGIADDNDDCPEGMPEDRDGFEDDDGCPEDDNDNDGVPDALDRCPKALEDLDQYQDDDGCPDPDNDGDGINDEADACPDVRGVASVSKKYSGCPPKDTDGDEILDDVDRCPEQPEDRDGRFDQDGCPDPDDDADGLLDAVDDCPTQRGPRRDIAGLNGCPDPDRDGDTYFGNFGDAFAWADLFGAESGAVGTPRDACPDDPEDFDGVKDDDGCPDPDPPKTKPTPLVTLEVSGTEGFVHLARPLRWESTLSAKPARNDLSVLRAIAKELRQFKSFTALVGIRAKSARPEDTKLAQERTTQLVRALDRLSLRDQSAKVGSFAEVAQAPNAQAYGIGIVLFTRGKPRVANPGQASVQAPAKGAMTPRHAPVNNTTVPAQSSAPSSAPPPPQAPVSNATVPAQPSAPSAPSAPPPRSSADVASP